MWKERTEKKKFEEGFAEEIKEIYALTQDDAGSCRMKGERCWTVSMRLLAHIDGKTAELLRNFILRTTCHQQRCYRH